MHLSVLQTKPFNPILGETLQLKLDEQIKAVLNATKNHDAKAVKQAHFNVMNLLEETYTSPQKVFDFQYPNAVKEILPQINETNQNQSEWILPFFDSKKW